MENKINKKNLKKYAATGILATTLFAGSGLGIYEACVDHTDGVCVITKMATTLGSLDSEIFNYGVGHQISQMIEEYSKQGYETNITFNPEYMKYDYEVVKIAPIVNFNVETSRMEYHIPEGYTLEYIENNYYGVKTVANLVEGPYMAFEIKNNMEEVDEVKTDVSYKSLKLK